VRDDQLNTLIDDLATLDLTGKTVVHHAGTVALEVLQPLAERGARIGKFHPLQSFSEATALLPRGIPFAIEGDIDELVLPWIAAWDGQAHHLSGDAWATYHLAAVIAANFLPLFIREGADLLGQGSTNRLGLVGTAGSPQRRTSLGRTHPAAVQRARRPR